jgi:hypothetical protein
VPDGVYPAALLQVTAEGELHTASTALVLVGAEGVLELETEGPAPGGPWLNWPTGETPRPTAPGKLPLPALLNYPVVVL